MQAGHLHYWFDANATLLKRKPTSCSHSCAYYRGYTQSSKLQPTTELEVHKAKFCLQTTVQCLQQQAWLSLSVLGLCRPPPSAWLLSHSALLQLLLHLCNHSKLCDMHLPVACYKHCCGHAEELPLPPTKAARPAKVLCAGETCCLSCAISSMTFSRRFNMVYRL